MIGRRKLRGVNNNMFDAYQFFCFGRSVFSRFGLEKFAKNVSYVTHGNSGDVSILGGENVIHVDSSINSLTALVTSGVLNNHIIKGLQPVLVDLFISNEERQVCEKEGFKVVASDLAFLNNGLGNKSVFSEFVEKSKNLEHIPYFLTHFSKLSHQEAIERLGGPYVVRTETGKGGRGVFFIHSKDDFLELEKYSLENVVVSKFVKARSVSSTAAIVGGSVYYSWPLEQIISNQILNPSGGPGSYCGSIDGGEFPLVIREKMNLMAGFFAEELKKSGYKGIFGVDYMYEESTGKVYPIELNPRFVSSSTLGVFMAEKKSIFSLKQAHVAAFLGEALLVDPNDYAQKTIEPPEITHFVVYADQDVCFKKSLKSGVYRLTGDVLDFIRPQYPSEEMSEGEFVIADNFFEKGNCVKKAEKILRIIFLEKQYDGGNKKISPFAERVVQMVREKITG